MVEGAIDTDIILGRSRARVHRRGTDAAIFEVTGIWYMADRQWAIVDELLAAGTLVGFSSNTHFLGNCRVLSHDYASPTGKLYSPYTITLLEDE